MLGLASRKWDGGPRRSCLRPHAVRKLTGAGAPPMPYMWLCAVLSGGMTAPLLTPGTGICKPAFGVAARCQQTVAAVD